MSAAELNLETDTRDMPTEHGCEMYQGVQAGVDASVVGICRDAGATIIGKTVSLSNSMSVEVTVC